MAHEDWIAARSRMQKAEYLRRNDQELLEQGRHCLATEVKLQQLGEATGVTDRATLEQLVRLGYTADTAQLPYLLPLVMVAWADGAVSRAERHVILEAATARHVGRESLAANVPADYLTHRPSEKVIASRLVQLLEEVPKKKCPRVPQRHNSGANEGTRMALKTVNRTLQHSQS